MFFSTEPKPVTIDTGTSCNRFFESRLKYSTVPLSLDPMKEKSRPMLVL